jgi:hypothetical protein
VTMVGLAHGRAELLAAPWRAGKPTSRRLGRRRTSSLQLGIWSARHHAEPWRLDAF